MGKDLIIVESPAKARTISRFLGNKYNVIASMGHVRDLPKSQLGVDIEDDFKPKYITIRGKGPTINKLRKAAKNSNQIFLATDPDREGEAISWHLAYILGVNEKEECRIIFREITEKSVEEAINRPQKIDINLVNAQQTRRILDRLVGYKISPILWRKVRKGLSAGRVQSVAVRLIADREQEINDFVPQEYWSLTAELEKDKTFFDSRLFRVNNKKVEIENKEMMDEILSDIKDKDFVVDKVRKGTRKKNPPLPFRTSTLQQEAYRKLGFTAKKTMVIAQQLYEGLDVKSEGAMGLITYMRTDSTRISETAKNEAKKYIINRYGEKYHLKRRGRGKKKGNIQDAHEAIRPTSVHREPGKIKSSLTKDQYSLYKLIWERFVASQMKEAIYDTVSADIYVKDNGKAMMKYIFRATGSTLKFPGFTLIYVESVDDEEDEETQLPELNEKEILKLNKLMPKQHFTQPPPRYTEAMLIRIMEEKGIGRPSTYAPIIDTIQRRNYVLQEKRRFKPTELGVIVVELLKEHFTEIIDYDFTADLESKLDRIELGEEKWVEILHEFYTPFNIKISKAEKEIKKVKIEDEVTDEICEKCGRNMVIKHGRYGEFLACPGFPECRNTKPIMKEIGVKCPKCGGEIVLRKTRKRRSFYGCSNYPECDFASWHKPIKERCPKCGELLVAKKSRGKKKVVECTNKECDYKK